MALSVPYSPINPRQDLGTGSGATACCSVSNRDDCDHADELRAKINVASNAIDFLHDVLVGSDLIWLLTQRACATKRPPFCD